MKHENRKTAYDFVRRKAWRQAAKPCTHANGTDASDVGASAFGLPCTGAEGSAMLMFKRSQLYVGLALAGLAEIIFKTML